MGWHTIVCGVVNWSVTSACVCAYACMHVHACACMCVGIKCTDMVSVQAIKLLHSNEHSIPVSLLNEIPHPKCYERKCICVYICVCVHLCPMWELG